MSINLQAAASLGKIDLPTAFTRMLDLLGSIDRGVKALQRADPPPQGVANVQTLELSSAGISQRQVPTEMHIVGLLFGADHTGRATLNIGTRKLAFYLGSQLCNYIPFGQDNPLVVRNDSVGWTPPSGSVVWDTTIFYRVGKQQMQGAITRV